MSKTLFKCFLVYYEHVFVYCDVFAVTVSFSMSLLSIFWTDFTPWSTFICYQFCIVSRGSHRHVLYERCSLKLRNIYWKTPVLGSLFNKVYYEETSTQVFSCKYGATLKAPVLKNICERLLLNGRHWYSTNEILKFYYWDKIVSPFSFCRFFY